MAHKPPHKSTASGNFPLNPYLLTKTFLRSTVKLAIDVRMPSSSAISRKTRKPKSIFNPNTSRNIYSHDVFSRYARLKEEFIEIVTRSISLKDNVLWMIYITHLSYLNAIFSIPTKDPSTAPGAPSRPTGFFFPFLSYLTGCFSPSLSALSLPLTRFLYRLPCSVGLGL